MRLSALALQKINNTPTRLRLALKIGCTERWISIMIKENPNDSDFTKAGIVQVIREETGLDDSQILEDVPTEAEQHTK